MLHKSCKQGNRNHSREHRTRYEVTNVMLRSVLEVARYTEMHIRYDDVISRELHNLETPWSLMNRSCNIYSIHV